MGIFEKVVDEMTKFSEETEELAAVIRETCTSCKRCMKDCVFLQKYCESPKELFEEKVLDEIEAKIPYSCMMCGRCTVVCPLQLELGDAFLSMRRDLIKESDKKLPLKVLKSVQFHQLFSCSRFFSSTGNAKKRKE